MNRLHVSRLIIGIFGAGFAEITFAQNVGLNTDYVVSSGETVFIPSYNSGAPTIVNFNTLTIEPQATLTFQNFTRATVQNLVSLGGATIILQNSSLNAFSNEFQGLIVADGTSSLLQLPMAHGYGIYTTVLTNGAPLLANSIFGPTYFNNGTLYAVGNGSIDASLDLGAGPSAALGYQSTPGITFNTNGYSLAIQSSLVGPGFLTKIGAGTLTLVGNVEGITNTTVSSGTLAIQGTFASQNISVQSGAAINITGSISAGSTASVQANGVIGGNGTLADLVVNSGGTLSPGNSIGTLTANGNVTLLPGSIYLAEVNGAGASDHHAIRGSTTIEGATVQVRPYQGGVFEKNKTYSILSANSGVMGRFGNISDSFAFLDGSLSYTNNAVNLTLSRNQTTFTSLAQTSNQIAVARALDAAESQGQAPTLLGTLYGFSEAEARSSYTSLSGEGIADIRGAATGGTHLFLGTIRDQMVFGGPRSSSPRPSLRVWATMMGGNLQLSSQGGYAGTMTQVWGGVGGFEKQFDPSLKAGLAIGGTSSNVSVSGLQTSGQVSFGHAALYAQKDFDAAYLLGAAGWSAGQSSTKRTLSLIGGLQAGSFNGQGPNGRLEAGYRFRWDKVEVTPYAAIQGAWIHQNAMNESGNSFGNLYVQGQTVSSIPASLGVQVKTHYALDEGWDLALRGRAAYVHDFTPSRTITAQMSGISQPFIASGMPMPANALDLGAGIELLSKSGFSANLFGDALIGEKAIGWRGQFSVGYNW